MLVIEDRLFLLEWLVWCPPLVTVVSSRLVLLGSSARVVARWILESVVAAMLSVFEVCLECVIMELFRPADQRIHWVELDFVHVAALSAVRVEVGGSG